MQYTLYGDSRTRQGFPLALVSGNTLLYFTEDVELVEHLREEFAGIWSNDNLVVPGLTSTNEWVSILHAIKDDLEHCRENSSTFSTFKVGEYLGR